VAALQHVLNLRGAHLDEKGFFGPITADRVRQFQQARGLESDAVVDSETRQALYDMPAIDADWDIRTECVDLHLDAEGDCVKSLQHLLNQHGAHLTGTGLFATKTDAAVRLFQKTHGIVEDGNVGVPTKRLLYDTPEGTPEPKAISGNAHCTVKPPVCQLYVSRSVTAKFGKSFANHPDLTDAAVWSLVYGACRGIPQPFIHEGCTRSGDWVAHRIVSQTIEAGGQGKCLRIQLAVPHDYDSLIPVNAFVDDDPTYCADGSP
jgi:hypothetical protein